MDMSRPNLLTRMSNQLNLNDLKRIYFQLGIDFDNIPGETKGEKITGLIEYLERRNKIDMLLDTLNNRLDVANKEFDVNNFRKELENFAKQGKLAEIISRFLEIVDQEEIGVDKAELMLLSSRFEQNNSKTRKGIISDSEATIEHNRINDALLELIKKIK